MYHHMHVVLLCTTCLAPRHCSQLSRDLRYALQAISNSLYALALMSRQHEKFIAGATLAIEQKRYILSAQQCSNTLWALVKLDAAMPETFEVLIDTLVNEHIGVLNSQDITNSLWALARADCLPREKVVVCTLELPC
jgi:hypothetical protein